MTMAMHEPPWNWHEDWPLLAMGVAVAILFAGTLATAWF
jgi:hypothetical protein